MRSKQFNGVDDNYFNALDPITGIAEAVGGIASAGAAGLTTVGKALDKKARMEELKSERQREKDACSKNKAFKGQGTRKRRQLILDCQKEVDVRYDEKVKEERLLINKQLDIAQSQIQATTRSAEIQAKDANKPNYLKWIGIGVGVIAVLGIGAYLLKRKK